MSKIQLTCQTCQHVYDLNKTPELPAHVFFMKCNWCPLCEDQADDYWQEWWDEDENANNKPIPVGDNQLTMPFVLEEIGVPNLETVNK